jgi:hypothetical protein
MDNNKIESIKKQIILYRECSDQQEKKILLNKIVEGLAEFLQPEAKAIVDIISNEPVITEGNYARYLYFLTGFKGVYRQAMKKALIDNGADIEGVDGAMMILNQ